LQWARDGRAPATLRQVRVAAGEGLTAEHDSDRGRGPQPGGRERASLRAQEAAPDWAQGRPGSTITYQVSHALLANVQWEPGRRAS
jgi:hypothetical protein